MLKDNRYIAFDVETPNYANDRMSAIGIVVVEDGQLTDRFYTLVNPETGFDSFNISLTGITPYMAARSPSFPELWEKLRSYLDTGILAAHNAPFDMSVLGKCLRDYGIAWKPRAEYVCTCQIGRRVAPELPNHRLDTMADWLALPLDHHNAASDTLVCAQLLQHYLEMKTDLRRFRRTFDFDRLRTVTREEIPHGSQDASGKPSGNHIVQRTV